MSKLSSAASAAAGISYLIIVQVLSRGLTFVLNQLLLRFLSPELLGLSAQLELYSISVLFFSRESIRVAAQRRSGGVQAVVNLSYVSILLGFPIAYLLARVYSTAQTAVVPHITTSLFTYGVACIMELAAEPAFVAVQQEGWYKIRALAETTAAVVRCLVTCAVVVWANRTGTMAGALPFACGQAGHAITLFSLYTVLTSRANGGESFTLLPARLQAIDGEAPPHLGLFTRPLTRLSVSLTAQATVKYVLTQADAILIFTLAPLADQGAYALASNYGGLVARMAFQPVEETARNLFAKLCHDRIDAGGPSAGEGGVGEAAAEVKVKLTPEAKAATASSSPSDLHRAADLLRTITYTYTLVSLLALSLGPSLAPVLLRLVAGRRWTDDTQAGDVLAMYCYYIPLLAFNGVIEAFVSAVATDGELYMQGLWMGGFSVAFAGAAWVFVGWAGLGAVGLLLANCVNMGLRIVWGSGFIRRYFEKRDVVIHFTDALPGLWSSTVAVGARSLLEAGYRPRLLRNELLDELLRGAVVAAAMLFALAYIEKEFLKRAYATLRRT